MRIPGAESFHTSPLTSFGDMLFGPPKSLLTTQSQIAAFDSQVSALNTRLALSFLFRLSNCYPISLAFCAEYGPWLPFTAVSHLSKLGVGDLHHPLRAASHVSIFGICDLHQSFLSWLGVVWLSHTFFKNKNIDLLMIYCLLVVKSMYLLTPSIHAISTPKGNTG